ncbi:MAG: GNAT family N-acetyltransferase [Candidatus Izemoplasmatales bacterium]
MIRTGKAEDAVILNDIARRVADELHASGVDQWSAVYPGIREFTADAAKGALFVAEEEGRIVGSISILPENDPAYAAVRWEGRNALVLHRVMVDPDARRHGIGAALFTFAIAKAMREGADAVKVDTHPDNARMKRMILRFGFVHRGHLPLIYREGYERVLR